MRKSILSFFVLVCMIQSVSAVDFIMANRGVNLSGNINYVVGINSSSVPMAAVQVTFNYDPTALMLNWVRQGDFLYYAKDDAKIWQVFYRNNNITVVSMVLFDFSILQTKPSTLMTISMKPLRKVNTIVNLSKGVIVGNIISDNSTNMASEIGQNSTIKIT